MNIRSGAISSLFRPHSLSILVMNLSSDLAIWGMSSLEPWKAEFAICVPSISTIGFMPLLLGSSSASTMRAATPEPTIMPFLLLSKGRAAFVTSFSGVRAPRDRSEDPSHSILFSDVGSSAPRTITLLHLPCWIQSWAMPTASVEDAQAEFTWVFGPLAFMYWANCECPIASTLNMNNLGK